MKQGKFYEHISGELLVATGPNSAIVIRTRAHIHSPAPLALVSDEMNLFDAAHRFPDWWGGELKEMQQRALKF